MSRQIFEWKTDTSGDGDCWPRRMDCRIACLHFMRILDSGADALLPCASQQGSGFGQIAALCGCRPLQLPPLNSTGRSGATVTYDRKDSELVLIVGRESARRDVKLIKDFCAEDHADGVVVYTVSPSGSGRCSLQNDAVSIYTIACISYTH